MAERQVKDIIKKGNRRLAAFSGAATHTGSSAATAPTVMRDHSRDTDTGGDGRANPSTSTAVEPARVTPNTVSRGEMIGIGNKVRQHRRHKHSCGVVRRQASKMAQGPAAMMDEAQASITKHNQHNQPKGFMRLPPELRVKIYELVLFPERPLNTSCSVNHLHGHDLANTSKSNKTSLLRMNVLYMRPCIQFGGLRRFITGNCAHVAILSTCRKVLEEASVVLYENTSLEIEQPYGYPSFSNAESTLSVLNQCPSYGLEQIRHFSLAFRIDGQRGPYQLVCGDGSFPSADLSWPSWAQQCKIVLDRVLLPRLKTVQLHIDIDLIYLTSNRHSNNDVDVQPFECLHNVANEVQFVVDMHIYRAWYDDGSGWGEQLVDNGRELDDDEADLSQAWSPIKEVAYELRKKFINDLSKVFERHGKQLKVKEI